MARSCIGRLCSCIFCPCILCFFAIKIYCCGCLSICCDMLLSNIAACCCGCCECFCCTCCGCTKQYTDLEFPPFQKSLGNDDPCVWVRVDDIIDNAPTQENMNRAALKTTGRTQLFEGKIEPADVSQGGLGDCWLMSAIAAVSEFPEVIRSIFITKRYSPYGKYRIQLYDGVRGQWEEVIIDNYIPCSPGTKSPVFAGMNNNEIWAVLLEKAVAKFCGSYQNIVGGNTDWALKTLTGFPTFVLSRLGSGKWGRFNLECRGGKDRRDICHVPTKEQDYSNEDLFRILWKYDELKAIMCCSSGAGKDTETSEFGIVQGHAYSLLGARKVDDFMFLRLRNPWGCGEWTGAWSDTSAEWSRYPAVKRELEFQAGDDGAFWIRIEDFVQNFRQVTICVRDTGFIDIALDPHEEYGCCGVCIGCVCGCASFWCCCQGCKALCCGEDAEEETVEGKRDGCCSCCPRIGR